VFDGHAAQGSPRPAVFFDELNERSKRTMPRSMDRIAGAMWALLAVTMIKEEAELYSVVASAVSRQLKYPANKYIFL